VDFTTITEIRIPRHRVVAKSTGTVDAETYVKEPDLYVVVTEVNNADRQTLESKIGRQQVFGDENGQFSRVVRVEKVESEYLIGRDFNVPNWRCEVTLVEETT